MKVIIKEFYDNPVNDEKYFPDQIVEVEALENFPYYYVTYFTKRVSFIDGIFGVETIDYIPKNICEIIE